MDNNTVTELLKNFRSYEYAAMMSIKSDVLQYEIDVRPLVYTERKLNLNQWDKQRYTRIVNLIRGAVDYVLNDDQRTVIMRKYLDRNTLTLKEIAAILHKDRTTVGRWHTEAINSLAKALHPMEEDEREINNFDHMFDRNWTYKEPA